MKLANTLSLFLPLVMVFIPLSGQAQQLIIFRGYGASQPKIRCENAATCLESEHALNRRAAFRVVSVNQ